MRSLFDLETTPLAPPRTFPVRALALLMIGLSFVSEHSMFMRVVGIVFLGWLLVEMIDMLRSSRRSQPSRRKV